MDSCVIANVSPPIATSGAPSAIRCNDTGTSSPRGLCRPRASTHTFATPTVTSRTGRDGELPPANLFLAPHTEPTAPPTLRVEDPSDCAYFNPRATALATIARGFSFRGLRRRITECVSVTNAGLKCAALPWASGWAGLASQATSSFATRAHSSVTGGGLRTKLLKPSAAARASLRRSGKAESAMIGIVLPRGSARSCFTSSKP
jgi:hypothetical protein